MKKNKVSNNKKTVFFFKANGFTLTEVLIALIVLAIGLLGVAGMQVNGVRTNHSAYLRSQATVLSYEIVDKMRSNRDRNSKFLDVFTNYRTDFDDIINNPPDCYSNACNVGQVAAFDLAEWKNSLQALPSGAGAITIAINGDIVIAEVSIRWDDTRGTDALATFKSQTRL